MCRGKSRILKEFRKMATSGNLRNSRKIAISRLSGNTKETPKIGFFRISGKTNSLEFAVNSGSTTHAGIYDIVPFGPYSPWVHLTCWTYGPIGPMGPLRPLGHMCRDIKATFGVVLWPHLMSHQGCICGHLKATLNIILQSD